METTKLNQVKHLYPLNLSYEALSVSLPESEMIAGEAMRQPYRGLLVHRCDMTETLEAHYAEGVELRVLEQRPTGDTLLRQVVLFLHDMDRPVEFGAIKIHLSHFDEEARELIIGGAKPLGAILQSRRIRHESHPQAYFRIRADEVIGAALDVAPGKWLYGRQNIHMDERQRPLAHIVEVLPPT